MVSFYLFFNSAIYLLFALFCLFKTSETASNLGYSFINNSGKVEYIAVYVGMELGFAAFLAICALYPSMSLAGIIFCVCMYAGLVVTRAYALLANGNVSKMIYIIGGLELALLIWGLVLLISLAKNPV